MDEPDDEGAQEGETTGRETPHRALSPGERESQARYIQAWRREGLAHGAVLYPGRRAVVHATIPTPPGGAVMADGARVVEKDGFRIQVESHDGEWCASIAYRREDGVHRPMLAAMAMDDVGALRELCRQVDKMRGAVVVAGKLAVKLRG